MNTNFNQVSQALTAATMTALKNSILGFSTSMPFLINLTDEEKASLSKINVSNKIFVEDTLYVATNNPSLVPGFVNVAEMQKDMTLFEQLDELQLLLSQLVSKLKDTQMLAGSEAYSQALSVYKYLDTAASVGAPGAAAAYAQLKQRFERQGNTTPGTDPDAPVI